MSGKGASKPCSGRKTLKRCTNNEEADDVVLIDVDSDNVKNVIILDAPESLPQKLRGSSRLKKDKKGPFRTIIYIDDDEGTENEHPEIGVQDDGTFPSDASSSSMRFSNHSQNSMDAFGDGCQFDHDNTSPVKLSKCKRTYSGKASARNRYGLSTESESGSDNECLDSEFMEDSSGKLREQWEKASLKRKYDTHNGQSQRGHCASASRFCVDKANYEQEDRSSFVAMGDGNLGSSSQKFKKTTTTFADFLLQAMLKTQDRHNKTDVPLRADPLTEDPSCTYTEVPNHQYFEHGGSSFCNKEQGSEGPPLCPINVLGIKQVKYAHKSFCDKESTPQAEPCLSKCESNGGKKFCHRKASLADEEAPLCDGQYSVETEVDTCNKDEKFSQTSVNSHFLNESTHGGVEEKPNSTSIDFSFRNSPTSNETQVSHGVCPSVDKARGNHAECFFCKNLSLGKSRISVGQGFPHENGEPVIEEPTFCNSDVNDGQPKQGESQMVEAEKAFTESMSNGEHKDEKDTLLYNQGSDVIHAVQSCIINERENLKETDAYKRAIEEEWASRQRELQIQAEEAQQLRRIRKRRKAESMRLLDMERRQKQRLEEMRETQKKDEENMKLKEQVRAEVRKELNKLEISCHDMASLLRGLGIQMDGALVPLPHEVRAAYKRALLTLHPDRATGSDIRQLVEAEEKFKLISRMKEKFLSTS